MNIIFVDLPYCERGVCVYSNKCYTPNTTVYFIIGSDCRGLGEGNAVTSTCILFYTIFLSPSFASKKKKKNENAMLNLFELDVIFLS